MNQDWTKEQDKEFEERFRKSQYRDDFDELKDYIHTREALLIERVARTIAKEFLPVEKSVHQANSRTWKAGYETCREEINVALQDLLASKEV